MSDTPPTPDSGWGPPPSGPAQPAAPGAPTPVVVPGWVSTDWMLALRITLVGLALLLLGGAMITLLNVLQVISGPGLSTVDWPTVSLQPVLVVLGWAGGGAGAPLYATGLLYSYLAYRAAAGTASSSVTALATNRARLFACAAKIGILKAGILLAVGILLNSFGEDLLFRSSGLGLRGQIGLTSVVFYAIFIGSIIGLVSLLSIGSTTLLAAMGITLSMPKIFRSGVTGARRTLIIGAPSLVIIHTLGSLLDSFSQAGVEISDIVSLFLIRISELALSGVDTAILLFLGATKFLHQGGYVWSSGSVSGWMWLSLPILAVAYLAGGVQAARTSQPESQARAGQSALLVGPMAALITLVVAIGWAGQAFIDDIVPVAILLSSLWGIIAVLGAGLWANQRGLPSGLTLEQMRSATTAEPTTPAPPQALNPPAAPARPQASPESAPRQPEPAPQRSPAPQVERMQKEQEQAEQEEPSGEIDLSMLPPPDPDQRPQA